MVLGDHFILCETVAWLCLRLGCVPVFYIGFVFSSLLSFPFLDLVIPQFYVGDVSVEGGGNQLVVEPAGRALGLPRLAMMRASSSPAARVWQLSEGLPLRVSFGV